MAKPDEHTVFGFLGGIQTSYTLMYTDYADNTQDIKADGKLLGAAWGPWEGGRRTGRDQQERGEQIREGKWEVKMIIYNVFMKMPSGTLLFHTLKN